MKKIYLLFVGAFISTSLLTQCTDPLKDFELNISTDIIHYSTVLQVEDGNGKLVNGVNVKISGRDADIIYNLAGKKIFELNSGLIGLGVHPKAEPTKDQPVKFNVELSGAGYVTQNIPITIDADQLESVKTINMLKIGNAPQGVVIKEDRIGLTNNATSGNQSIKTSAGSQTQQTIAIDLSDGTEFQDENEQTLSGDELHSTIVYVDPAQEAALNIFPGGSLTSTNVIAAGGTGTQVEAGVFIPAAVVNIEFFLGNTQIRRFSKPITLTMDLDPAFENIDTGEKIKAGDQLGIYSYQTTTGQWRFEKNITVEYINGKPVAKFDTNHLTWYMVGNYQASCSTATTINLNASWMQAGYTYPLKIEAILGGKVISAIQISASTINNTVRMPALPFGSGKLSIRVTNDDGQVLTTSGSFLSANGCNISHQIILNRPEVIKPKVTLQLYVRCPGNQIVLNVLPTFYLYYRESNTQQFKLLGVVKNGFLSSSLLTAGVEYDFKAIWGERVKLANDKVVTLDNSATVGIEPGDIIGEKDGANNLQMLTEVCP